MGSHGLLQGYLYLTILYLHSPIYLHGVVLINIAQEQIHRYIQQQQQKVKVSYSIN
jgi:hypothetical protein